MANAATRARAPRRFDRATFSAGAAAKTCAAVYQLQTEGIGAALAQIRTQLRAEFEKRLIQTVEMLREEIAAFDKVKRKATDDLLIRLQAEVAELRTTVSRLRGSTAANAAAKD